MEPKTGLFRFGRCRVIVTIDEGAWHLSISTDSPKILPSYKEIKAARYKFLPDEIYVAEIFPPKADFISIAEVRHLYEIDIDKSNYHQ
jgi:hypothetical protein